MLDLIFLFLNKAHDFFLICFVSMGAWNCHYCVRMILYYLSAVFFNLGSFLLWLTSQAPPPTSPQHCPCPWPLAFPLVTLEKEHLSTSQSLSFQP